MEFNRVLVGVDFSAASLAAARWVAAHFAPRAEVMLAHVLPERDAPPFVRPYLPPMLEVVSEVAPALFGGLRGLADLIGAHRTHVDLLTGPPADALAAAAAEFGADLICLGRMRSRRGGARFGATTAQRLLTRTRVPVLVVPATRPSAPTRVLAAIDERPGSRTVLEAAWRAARAGGATGDPSSEASSDASSGASMDALHVLGPELRALVRASRATEQGDAPGSHLRLARDEDESPRLRDEAHLFDLTREWVGTRLRAAGVSPARGHPHVRVGDPGQEIVGFAHATGVDLITIGRGGEMEPPGPASGSLPLGSTTRLVMWAAPCPVLVVSPAVESSEAGPPPERGRRRQGAPRLAARTLARATFDRRPPLAPFAHDVGSGPDDAA